MNKKKLSIIVIIGLLAIAIGSVIYYYFIHESENSTLTIAENQWIENHKNNVIDISIVTDIPVFSVDGEGVIFDFLNDLEKDTGLSFNRLSYSFNNKAESDYYFAITDEKTSDDVVLYHGNYVIVTKTNKKYTNLEDIEKMTLGTLEKDLEKGNQYLKANTGFKFKTYKTLKELIKAVNNNLVTGIVLPKILYLNTIGTHSDLNISYNITEMPSNIVLHLGDNKKLNNIIKKYHKKWNKEDYEDSYHDSFSNYYFTKNEIYENDQIAFKSKRYMYGFIQNPPFDALNAGRLVGTNKEILQEFAHLSGIEINYQEYKNMAELIDDFNKDKIDIFMNLASQKQYELEYYETVDVYDPQIYIISKSDNDVIINSLSSLVGKKVSTIKDSKILNSLSGYDISIETFNNLPHLLEKAQKDSVIVLDRKSYETYMNDRLKDYKIDYMYKLDDGYNFVIRKNKENKVLEDYFNFYLSYINEKEITIDNNTFKTTGKNMIVLYILAGILSIGLIILIGITLKKHKKKKKVSDISKEEKIRYIDDLTSLKNRRYLNETMQTWDDSEIYPQTIIIIDLNNLAYINDNYGHEEGDKTIVEAANVLITNQLENSEIVRTDGNEFLIYLVGYDEKQIISYIRKLNKELKDLSHGFGAATGYSMITDEIKTIDDAINEATLDMKSNKEEG